MREEEKKQTVFLIKFDTKLWSHYQQYFVCTGALYKL